MDIIDSLIEMGLTKNEAKAYLALLRLGEAKAGELAMEARLERTSAYNALGRLSKIGLVSYVISGNRKVFSAGPPEKLKDYFNEKLLQAGMLIPQLEKIERTLHEKETIFRFRGFSGVKNALNDVLHSCNQGDEYLVMGSEGQLSERLPLFSKIFIKQKDAKRLKTRILIRKERGKTPHMLSKYTEYRVIPKEVLSTAVTSIYNDRVSIILWTETPEAIIIDNKNLAQTFKAYFEFMWKHAHRHA